jgi:hypothetical protein
VPNQILGLIESGKARFVLSLKELIEVTGRYNPFIQFHPINKKDGTPKSDVPEEVYMTYSWAGPNNNILLMNSPEDKARKRDGEAMVVYGSHYRKSAHRKYSRVTKVAFGKLQNYLYNWLEHQPHPVIVVPLVLFGGSNLQSIKLMVMPENCAPVAIASGLLQWFVTDPTLKLSDTERVGSVTVFAPPLQRAYFDNQQTVVHFRDGKMRVAFALTTYLGPTTKKECDLQGPRPNLHPPSWWTLGSRKEREFGSE